MDSPTLHNLYPEPTPPPSPLHPPWSRTPTARRPCRPDKAVLRTTRGGFAAGPRLNEDAFRLRVHSSVCSDGRGGPRRARPEGQHRFGRRVARAPGRGGTDRLAGASGTAARQRNRFPFGHQPRTVCHSAACAPELRTCCVQCTLITQRCRQLCTARALRGTCVAGTQSVCP